MDNRPIGMFDSGVGGLTVYKEIKKALPNEKIIYIGDTKRFPYGSKAKETIVEASKRCVEFLISQNVKLIIIACGTATSQALEILKKTYNIPIIGIIDPTVEYIKRKNYKKVAVIATRGTIESGSWEKCLRQKISDIDVINQACPLLAPMAEEGWTNNEIARLTVKEYLKNIKEVDALILGCTHYPLYEKIIKELRPETKIVNTGKVIAKYLNSNKDVGFSNKNIGEDKFYLSDTQCNFVNVATKLLEKEIKIKLKEI